MSKGPGRRTRLHRVNGIWVPGASPHAWDIPIRGAKCQADGAPNPGVTRHPDTTPNPEVGRLTHGVHIPEAQLQTHPNTETLHCILQGNGQSTARQG